MGRDEDVKGFDILDLVLLWLYELMHEADLEAAHHETDSEAADHEMDVGDFHVPPMFLDQTTQDHTGRYLILANPGSKGFDRPFTSPREETFMREEENTLEASGTSNMRTSERVGHFKPYANYYTKARHWITGRFW